MFKHYISQMQIYIYNYVNIKLLFYFFCVLRLKITCFSVRTDRRRRPYRPTQTSVSTDADARIDRRGWFVANF